MSLKQKKIKFPPRIKLNHNIYVGPGALTSKRNLTSSTALEPSLDITNVFKKGGTKEK